MSMLSSTNRQRRVRSRHGASEISQFIPAVYIAILVVLMPLINLGNVFVAAAIQYLSTNDVVSKAATQPDYNSSLNAMVAEAYYFQSLGLAKFVRLAPQGGYTGCGDDLFILTTDITSGTRKCSAADMPLSSAVDTTKSIYELSVTSNYSVPPLIDLSSVPFLRDVPGLGQPVNLSFTVSRPVEHPGGLQLASAVTGGGQGTQVAVTPFIRNTTGNTAPGQTWRDPIIYPQILATGETVVGTAVLLVEANNPNWTPTSLTVAPGDKIWIDTQAVGLWENSPGDPALFDANGQTGHPLRTDAVVPSIVVGALVGEIGPPSGTPFFLGDQQFNYPPPGSSSGPLSMLFNDVVNTYGDNTGAQIVRIVVTR